MAYNYVETPRTEAADRTNLSAANLSFSEMAPFQSPSKDSANDLVHNLRSRTVGSNVLKTPRARSALSHLRNGGAKNEFTPLLKSAAANRFKASIRKPSDYDEEKENTQDDLINSMMAAGPGEAPRTPAYLRPGYAEAQTPGLPMGSSMLRDEDTRSSSGTPAPQVGGSSSLMSTPMPVLPPRGEEGRGDQGNVLTLREQEAVSDTPGSK
jgi:hypothetical protein